MKMRKSDKIGIAQTDLVLERLCVELFNNGLNFYKIANLLNISTSQVKSYFPEGHSYYPDNQIDEDSPLIQKILYDFDMPVGTEVLIENEKQRYLEYSKLEKTALHIMNSMLEYYSAPTGDLKVDMAISRMASDFIRVTQSARQELIQKYAIDKKAEEKDKDSKINIEFV